MASSREPKFFYDFEVERSRSAIRKQHVKSATRGYPIHRNDPHACQLRREKTSGQRDREAVPNDAPVIMVLMVGATARVIGRFGLKAPLIAGLGVLRSASDCSGP